MLQIKSDGLALLSPPPSPPPPGEWMDYEDGGRASSRGLGG